MATAYLSKVVLRSCEGDESRSPRWLSTTQHIGSFLRRLRHCSVHMRSRTMQMGLSVDGRVHKYR